MNTMTPVSVPTVSSSAMLVELSISVWTARKKDKAVTTEVLTSKHAIQTAGNFNKNLLADCAELAAIQKFSANARNMHYNMTIPWSDSGLRLLPTAKYFDYQNQITQLKDEFDRMVQNFLNSYNWEVAQVHAKLGDLFNRDEYPTEDTLASKFSFRVNYLPVPEAGDWRVDVESETQHVLREQYETFYESQMERAMRDVWERLHDHLSRLINQLGVSEDGKKGKVFDSTIENVRNLADMLGHCNYTNDPNLDLAHRKLVSALSGVCRDDVVKNESFRSELRSDMQEALKALPSLDW